MRIVADLQIHSKYSRAVSPAMDLFEIAHWAGIKGVQLVATGDWTHPLWFSHMKENLRESEPGIYALRKPADARQSGVRFLLSTEISSIYTHKGKQRRVHNLIFSPSLSICEKIIQELLLRGCNLQSDGRPIVGLSSEEIAELVFAVDEHCMIIPAHAWTPWFALYGSKSGYDSIEACFGPYADRIYAIETGLSSDPAMNWQISELDHRALVSFSDAHSGAKIGREATVFIHPSQHISYTYQDIISAIRQDPQSQWQIGFTIEYFPEEGKYHWSGHRACNVIYTPDDIVAKGIICPVCGKPLTVGVENRVRDLAEKTIRASDLVYKKNHRTLTFVYDPQQTRKPFVSLIPLLEIFTHIYQSPTKAKRAYESATANHTEFDLLMHMERNELIQCIGLREADAVYAVRNRIVTIDPGYDGVFGTIHIPASYETQPTLFTD